MGKEIMAGRRSSLFVSAALVGGRAAGGKGPGGQQGWEARHWGPIPRKLALSLPAGQSARFPALGRKLTSRPPYAPHPFSTLLDKAQSCTPALLLGDGILQPCPRVHAAWDTVCPFLPLNILPLTLLPPLGRNSGLLPGPPVLVRASIETLIAGHLPGHWPSLRDRVTS